MPILSVIIPCYNNGNLLKEMIDCCIQQTFDDWELIIVDDQSTDNFTQKLVKDYVAKENRIKFLIRNRLPKGSVTCRNIGLYSSLGKYIIHFDANDLISNTCFENRVKFMEEHPDVEYASFPARAFWEKSKLPSYDDNGQIWGDHCKYGKDLLASFLRADYPFSTWNNIYRKASIEKIEWDEQVKIYTDFSFILPCIFAGLQHAFSELKELDYYYRMAYNSNNMCASFVSDEKCESTLYLFDKIILELHKHSLGKKYIKIFREFVLLHYERLIYENNKQHIDEFISFCDKHYKMHKRLKFMSFLSLMFKKNRKLQKGITYCFFSILFGYTRYIKIILSRV